MFGWFKKKEKRGTGENWFLPEERLIYRYFDGTGIRAVDPKLLHETLLAKRNSISADYKVAVFEIPNEFTKVAETSLYKTIRTIFSIPPLGPEFRVEYEQDGKMVKTLSDSECLALLDHFLLFVEGVKKNTPSSQTSSLPSEPLPFLGDERGDTRNGSASGSTGTGDSIVRQGRSLTVQQ